MDAKTGVKEASLAVVVIRADGSREDLGVVSYWNKSWWRRFWWRLQHG